jgi:hypothetical protein
LRERSAAIAESGVLAILDCRGAEERQTGLLRLSTISSLKQRLRWFPLPDSNRGEMQSNAVFSINSC